MTADVEGHSMTSLHSVRADCRGPQTTPGASLSTRVTRYAAADSGARMRWSNAPSEAFAPSPTAMTICLYGTTVQSPAAKTPGTDVRPRASTSTSPRGESLTVPFSQSVFGTNPICTNTPARSTV